MDLSTKELPAGHTMRAPRHEDAEAVVALLRACDVARGGRSGGRIGFIRELGVLKSWRGKGVGTALLTRSFEEFRGCGQLRVALGVDAENESAIGLYERAGMRVEGRHYLMRRGIGA